MIQKINAIAYSQKKSFRKNTQQKSLEKTNPKTQELMSKDLSSSLRVQFFGAMQEKQTKKRKIMDNVQRNMNNFAPLDNIAGYEQEKEILYKEFISKIELEKLGESVDIPSSVLFFGPPNNGKSAIANSVAKAAGCEIKKVKIISDDFNELQQIIKKIMQIAIEAEEDFDDTYLRTIIVIDEIDRLFEKDSPIKEELLKFMEECSDKYHCTVFATTSYPLELGVDYENSKIFPIRMSIDPANFENKMAILKHCAKIYGFDNEQIDYQEIVNAIEEIEKKQGVFIANGEIKYICMNFLEETLNTQPTTKEIIDYIKNNILDTTSLQQTSLYGIKQKLLKKLSLEKLQIFNILSFSQIDSIESAYQAITLGCKETFLEDEDSIEEYQLQIKQLASKINIVLDGNMSDEELASVMESIKDLEINNKKLIDYWIDLTGGKSVQYTDRLKAKWLAAIIQDKKQLEQILKQTLKDCRSIDLQIEAVKRSFAEILKEENSLSQEDRRLLLKIKDSKKFFSVIADQGCANDILAQINILELIKTLSHEKEMIKQNADRNIFQEAEKLNFSNCDLKTNEVLSSIFELVNQELLLVEQDDKIKIETALDNFIFALARQENEEEINLSWLKLIELAKKYFNDEIIDIIAYKNIELLNRIKVNTANEKNKVILDLVSSNFLSLEQKDFVVRYKNDRNFRQMIGNTNIDSSIIEELTLFEAANIALAKENDIDLPDDALSKIMSEKFQEINKKNKDINLQGEKIVSKLEALNTSFVKFANISIEFYSHELQQLSAINQQLLSIEDDTNEILKYSQGIMRAKLAELQKDSNYKEIVADIVSVLPVNEQINLDEFLFKVDALVKKEKNKQKRSKILKAAAIVASSVTLGIATHYFGPTVVAHLTSKMPSEVAAIKALAKTTSKINLAKMLGNSKMLAFENGVGYPKEWRKIKKELLNMRANGNRNADRVIAQVEKSKGTGGISLNEIVKILHQFNIYNLP